MNTKPKILVFVGYALYLALVVLGILVAFAFLPNHKDVANGVLGFAVWSLTYRLFILPKKYQRDERTLGEALLTFPVNLRIFIGGFVWAMVLQWAVFEMIGAIRYLIRLTGLGM